MIVKIGTRGSRLSLIQTDSVIDMLRRIGSDLEFQKVIMKTAGDVFREKSLYSFGAKGIFEREINLAVIEGRVDFAVHSLKDLPSEEYDELGLAAIPKRESPNDVLISNSRKTFTELKANNIVGTSSVRRMMQIKLHRPDLRVVRLRGNVETRLRKAANGEFDAVVLAEAGVKRLGLQDKVSERLPLNMFVPAPGQGALVAVARKDDDKMLRLLSKIDDRESRNECVVERIVASKLSGGCQVPMGIIAHQTGNSLSAYSALYSIDGRKKIACNIEGKSDNASDVAERLANKLLEFGASGIIDEWRKTKVNW
ncbi:MAG TPA: hydroxymethylbilane synthase [Thermodesulfobacteriota bacterium]|nr:hydroxymethylbilane synthase [Thermodesulfobacteriota bacterium]